MVTTTNSVNIQTGHVDRVPILPFDLGPVEEVKVNRSAVERRAACSVLLDGQPGRGIVQIDHGLERRQELRWYKFV